jgi:hypothetical protein
MRHRLTRLVVATSLVATVCAVTAFTVVTPAAASSPILGQLGPAPQRCFFAPGPGDNGCDVYNQFPYMDSTYYGSLVIQRHLVTAGEYIEATPSPADGGSVDWYGGGGGGALGIPGAVVESGCQGGSGQCTVLAPPDPYPPQSDGSPWSGGWEVATVSFCGFFGCAPSQDYFYVSPNPTISGYVLDAAGQPVPDANVSISGTTVTGYNSNTGYYNAIVDPGTYDVTASTNGQTIPVSACTGQISGHACSVTVTNDVLSSQPHSAEADFTIQDNPTITGVVTNTAGTPQLGTTISLTNTACFNNSTSCTNASAVTGQGGQYSADVQAGSYTVSPTSLSSGTRFDPSPAPSLTALNGQTVTQDFTLTTGPVIQTVSPNAEPWVGGQVVTVTGQGFGSAGAADTVQFCTAQQVCTSGVSPSVQSDSVIDVTAPDMSSIPVNGQPPSLLTNIVVTNVNAQQSVQSTGSQFTFGCEQYSDLMPGAYTAAGCFTPPGEGSSQYQTNQPTTIDGGQLTSSGNDQADVNTSSGTYTSQSPATFALQLAGSQLATLLTGVTNLNLANGPQTFTAAAGANLGGFPVSGSVTFTSVTQQTMKITATVKLPTILGGATGTITVMSTEGTGVTSMDITVNSGQPENVAQVFALSNLDLNWTRATSTWTITAAGTATSNPFALTGNLTYGNGSITSGNLNITGNVVLAGGVLTFQNIALTYAAGAGWSANATIGQASGVLAFAIKVDGNGNIVSGSIMSQGAVTLFSAITLQSFAMTWSGGQWTASASAGQGGTNTISVATVPVVGGIQSFNLTLANFSLGSAIQVNTMTIKYAALKNEYSGSLSVTLSGSHLGVAGAVDFQNGTFNSGSLDFTGLHIPLGSTGVFIVGGGAAITLTPAVTISGNVNLEFGPEIPIAGVAAFGASVMMSYTFASGSGTTATPWSATLSGEVAAGGVPGVNPKAISLGNGSIKITQGGAVTLCVAAGGAGAGGCQSQNFIPLKYGSVDLGEQVSGIFVGTISLTSADLTGTLSAKGKWFPQSPVTSATIEVNNYGIAGCAAGHGFTWLWGNSTPTSGCPANNAQFTAPTITAAASGNVDPTTGLNVAQGGTASVSANGFAPGEVVSGTLASGGAVVGSANANGAGDVTVPVTIPSDEALGAATLTLTGATSGDEVALPLMVSTSTASSPTTVVVSGPDSIAAGGSYGASGLADGTPAPSYSLSGAPSWLAIDPSSGAITGTEPNDGETSFGYSVIATNGSGSAQSAAQTVTVQPDASPTTVTVQSLTTITAGQPYSASASADGTPAGSFTLSAAPSWLSIDPVSGAVSGVEPNNGETSFSYAVTSTNATGSATSATETVSVTAPSSPTTVTVTGSASVNAGASYSATTIADGGPPPSFSLSNAPSWLSIDSLTGDVSGTEPNTGETSFSYDVVANNGVGSATSATVTVTVTPNTAPTTVTVTGPSTLSSNSDYDATTVADGSPSATFTFASSPAAPSWLSINPATGEVTGGEPGDFEPSFSYAVVATNVAGSATSATQTVTVVSPPVFTSASPNLSLAAGGAFNYTFTAQALPDAPTYALDAAAPSWLSINSATGQVSGTEPNDGEFSFSFFVTATNSEGVTTVGPFTVAIDIAPVFTADSPPLSSNNYEAYQYQFQANGGPDGVTYAVESASPWLSINPYTGIVTATDGEEPTYTYSVVASDAEGSTTAGPFTVTTNEAPYFTYDNPQTLLGTLAGYGCSFVAYGLPDAPTYAFASSPPAPSWLSINSTTGYVSGTEPGTGETSFTYAVTATNSQGSVTTPVVTVDVEPVPLFSASSPPTAVPAGGSYSYQFAAANVGGATGGPNYSLGSNAPWWLSIDPSTGLVTGTEPNDGEASFMYSVSATNNTGTWTVGPYTVDVDLAPSFTVDTPPTSLGDDYADYDYTFTATSLPDAPTYSLSSASPSWLSVDATTGEVTGTEPDNGTTPFTYSVIATNSQGHATAGPFTVIFGPPVVTSVIDLDIDATSGVNPDDQIEVTGTGFGDSPYVYLDLGSCSVAAGDRIGTLNSSQFTVNGAGTQILFNVPYFPTYNTYGRCSDLTLPIDVIVAGHYYHSTSGLYPSLNSANDEPSDELSMGQPVAPTPTVTSVVDTTTGLAQGPIDGGDGLTITGTDFVGVTSVTFTDASCTYDPGTTSATVPASDLTVSPDGTTITLTSPDEFNDWSQSACNGTVDTDVQVEDSAPPSGVTGQSAVNEPDDVFTFLAPTPTVTSISDSGSGAASGSLNGGDQITITGTDLYNPTLITFTDAGCTGDPGNISAQVTSGITSSADGTTATFTSPGDIADLDNACPDGGVLTDVQVTDDAAANYSAPESPVVEPNDEFEFDGPTVSSVTDAVTSSNVGTASGGDTLTISGTDFAGATGVSFVDSSCTGDSGTTSASFTPSQFVVNSAGTVITLTSPDEAADTNNQCSNGELTTDVVVTESDNNGDTATSSEVVGDEYNFQFPYVAAVTDAVTDGSNGSVIPGDSLTITGSGFTGATSVSFVTQGCMPDPGVTLASVLASKFTVSGGGTEISLTSPGNLADMSAQCYHFGAYVDVVVSVTDPTTHDVLTSGVQGNDGYQFQPPTSYSEQGPTGNYFLDAVGGQTVSYDGWGFTGVTAVRYTYGGHVLATEPVTNVSWGGLNTVMPNLSALAVDLPSGHHTLAVGIQTETPDAHVAGGIIYSIVYPNNYPFTIAFPSVTSVRTSTGALAKGPLTGGEPLTITGSGLGTATSVAFQYTNAAGGTGSVSVPVTSVNAAETSLTVTAPNLGLDVGLAGVNDIHLATSATSVLTSVRVVTSNAATHGTLDSPLSSPADQFSFTVPARTHPAITSSATGTAVVGTEFTYTITTSGWPHPTITASGLPRWLKLTKLGNGTATLTGKPTATGSAHVTVTASNGVSPAATLHLVVTVDSAPHFVTGFSTTATVGVRFSTTIHATGVPTPVVSATGLPSWVTATAGTGDLVLTGTPTVAGTWSVTLTATNVTGHASEVVVLSARTPSGTKSPHAVSRARSSSPASRRDDVRRIFVTDTPS